LVFVITYPRRTIVNMRKRWTLWQILAVVYLLSWVPALIVFRTTEIAWPVQTLGIIGILAIVIISSFSYTPSRKRYADAVSDEDEENQSPPPQPSVRPLDDQCDPDHLRRTQAEMNLEEWNTNDGVTAPAQRREGI
jgi:hypothetical protein